jgi:hypothetical protein
MADDRLQHKLVSRAKSVRVFLDTLVVVKHEVR